MSSISHFLRLAAFQQRLSSLRLLVKLRSHPLFSSNFCLLIAFVTRLGSSFWLFPFSHLCSLAGAAEVRGAHREVQAREGLVGDAVIPRIAFARNSCAGSPAARSTDG